MSEPRYRPVSLGGSLAANFVVRADGSTRVTSQEALRPCPLRLTDRLLHWAAHAPERTLAARRVEGGEWRHLSYAEAVRGARSIAQALIERELSAERPVAILSDNDLEHLLLSLACMLAGVPYAPISPAYSLMSQDHGKLKHILGVLTPGLVFAASGSAYARAIHAAVPRDCAVVLTHGRIDARNSTSFSELLATATSAQVDAAHAKVGPDTIAKFLFTSGSTQLPKGVINTQRMLCSNQQMILQCFPTLGEEPPVLVDWLPWNHTFGGNHNVGLVIYNGGTLYIDDGKPTPALIGETLRNLREIAPTVYFNVPKGFEEIANAMEADRPLRDTLLSRVKMFFFAGAGLSQPVWDKLDRVAEAACGERIRMLTGLGMTETAPFAICANGPQVKSGYIGLPAPGIELKLVPTGDKTELRYRGPNVTPGYWRAPQQTAESFDDEGFYCSGDALKVIDPATPQLGFAFDGRIAEDFKLATGTFVSVGPLRAKVIAQGDPCVQDAVIAGINRNDIGVLVFPRIDTCRQLAGLAATAAVGEVLAAAPVRLFFQQLVDRLHASGSGSATRVARALVLLDPPSIDRGEITDKGSINQRAVLTHREALVERLYGGGDGVIVPAASIERA
ncbi:feruloyl-CoA synthase [Piscinibacter sp.]|jgi:feruloyl-CoA synthase|uniref:feruloyl-CoA synthase n=1 Tax=Piscinibacter sp. TaxID=1903157 RepID=UPI002F3F8299